MTVQEAGAWQWKHLLPGQLSKLVDLFNEIASPQQH